MLGNNEKYVWLEEREYTEEFTWLYKAMYYLGVLETKKWAYKGGPKQIYSGGYYRSLWGFRFWNPISWLFISVLFICLLLLNIIIAFDRTVKEFREMNRQEIKIDKKLIKKDDYEKE